MTRTVAALLALAAGGLAGCTSLETTPGANLSPGRIYSRCLVYLDDGARYDFRRVAVRADSVIGEYRVTVEHPADESGAIFEDETRVFPIPLSRVDSLAVYRRDLMKTFFYGAGLAAVGYAVYEMIDSDDLGRRSRNGKPGQGGPD